MKEKLKKFRPYLLNSLLIIGLFCLILIISKSAPFGSKLAIGKSDAIYQYKPMLYNFIMRLKTGTLLQYTFNNGLGNSFFFNFAYYLTSPLNLIAIFFNNPDIMYLSVILIKVFLTVIFCTFYAKKKGCSDLTSFIVAISYVFSSWFMVYYYNIMWLDTFMIFPLFQYGLEKLINEKRIPIFVFTFAYLYATNFYLAFSVLVYALVYFIIVNFFYRKDNFKEKIKKTLLFFLALIIGILIIAFYFHMLIVVKKQMGLGFSDASDSPYILTTLNFLKSLFFGNNILTKNFSGITYPNIALNTFIMLNVIYYFLNSKIKPRDKAFAFIAITLIIDCLFSPKLDYIMHFFHYVAGLTYRYTFIFAFLAIMLFIKNVNNFDQKDFKKMIPVISIILIILLLIGKNMASKVFILNIISLVFYLLITIFYKDNKLFKTLITSFIVIETFIVGVWTIPSDESIEKNRESFKPINYTYRLNTIDDDDYMNKNLYSNQDVTYLFSSMTYNDVLDTVYNLGFDSGKARISGNFYNDLYSLLFNVKNELYLEKIYAVNSDIKNVKFNRDNIKENTEDLVFKMTGIKDIYNEIILKPIKNDELVNYYKTDFNYYLVQDGEEIYVAESGEFKTNKKVEQVLIYTLNQKKLQEIYDTLKDKQIKYTSYNDDKLEGNINVSKDEIIFTSIPYDEAWKVTIDGEIVKPIKLLDSLIGIEVKEGEHQIIMEYKNDFSKSIFISIFTSISFSLILIIKKVKNKRLKEKN